MTVEPEHEIVLLSEGDRAGWKENSEKVTLTKKGEKLVLREISEGDNPYKSESWSSDQSWELDIKLAIEIIKKHGQKLLQ